MIGWEESITDLCGILDPFYIWIWVEIGWFGWRPLWWSDSVHGLVDLGLNLNIEKWFYFYLNFRKEKNSRSLFFFFFFFLFRWISNVASFNYVKTMWCWCVREKVMLLWSCINYLSSVISTVKILNYWIVKSMWFWCVRGKSINYLPSVISTIKILNYWIVLCG